MPMPAGGTPLVSVAIPLYRSRQFVDVIARNVDAIDYPATEILISDRHQEDDALEVLAARFAGNRRIRILRADDRLGWVDHYNLLLTAASGEYFLWMPHDDTYPAGFISTLVACLERHPRAVLAFGGVDVVAEDNRSLWSEDGQPPRVVAGATWTPGEALRTMMFRSVWLPQFHGVFRRERAIGARLFIRPTSGNVEPDLYWVFGLGLLGEFCFVPDCRYLKRLHGTNASVGWGARRARHVLDGITVPYGYLRDFAPSRFDHLRALPLLLLWGSLRTIGWLTQNWRWPSEELRTRAKRQAERLLFGGPRGD